MHIFKLFKFHYIRKLKELTNSTNSMKSTSFMHTVKSNIRCSIITYEESYRRRLSGKKENIQKQLFKICYSKRP